MELATAQRFDYLLTISPHFIFCVSVHRLKLVSDIVYIYNWMF
jgi:hypothetical protein